MSNILKFKLFLIFVSVLILTLIPLFESNFNAEVKYYEWKQLTWDDFQGFAKPFTRWDASISSSVYVNYDSAAQKYRAFASMNNQLSWKKGSSVGSDYLLNHEQYHFNITEYHARLMNEYLAEHGDQSKAEISKHLGKIRTQLREMQKEYDDESDHSRNRDMQRWWEFRIDSLLNNELEQRTSIDYFTGASAYFPVEPVYKEDIRDDQSYRYFSLDKYDMTLGFISFQEQGDFYWSREITENHYLKDSLLIMELSFDSLNSSQMAAYVKIDDTISNEIYYHHWIYTGDYFYKVIASFPDSDSDRGYEKIADSFLQSFQVVDVSDHWIQKFNQSNRRITLTSTAPKQENSKSRPVNSMCLVKTHHNKNGFYGKPIFDQEGALYVPYRIMKHPDSLISDVAALYDNGWYSYELQPQEQIIYIPSDQIATGWSALDFGYLLKEDTAEECFQYYYETINLSVE